MTDNIEEENNTKESCKTTPKVGFHTNPERINRNGRPKKGTAIADCMREYLDGEIDGQDGKTRKQAFVRAIYAAAMKGNTAAQALIWHTLEGRPDSKIDITTDTKPALQEQIEKYLEVSKN